MSLRDDTNRNPSFKKLTREQILCDLAVSRKQIENGEYDDFDEFIDMIGDEYNI